MLPTMSVAHNCVYIVFYQPFEVFKGVLFQSFHVLCSRFLNVPDILHILLTKLLITMLEIIFNFSWRHILFRLQVTIQTMASAFFKRRVVLIAAELCSEFWFIEGRGGVPGRAVNGQSLKMVVQIWIINVLSFSIRCFFLQRRVSQGSV